MDNRSLTERMEKFIVPVPEAGCWLWIGQIDPNFGYGRLKYKCRSRNAHRMSWEAFRGLIPEGMSVLHKCDTPSCVNPEHLYLGTQLENMRDRQERKRFIPHLGDANHATRIPDKFIDEILASNLPSQELADKYGVTYAGIHFIRNGKRTGARGKTVTKPIRRPRKGEAANFVKLKEVEVLAILASNDSQESLGVQYGVSRSCIQGIKNRKRWTHLC